MVIDDAFTHVHGLVIGFDLVNVTEGGVHLLFDNGSHRVGQLVCKRIQKCELLLLFFLRKGTHCNKLADEPLVGLSQLA